MDKFQQSMAALLPQGYAWPRDPDSTLMRLLAGSAAAIREFDAVATQATVEWLPIATRTRLQEWEDAVGLPDQCFGAMQTVAARRSRLLARLRGPSGYYFNSSPASLASIEAICTNLGYPGHVRYNHPFRCGRDRVGRRVGQIDGRLKAVLDAPSRPFRVGQGRVGDRLILRPAEVGQLACYLQNYVPARYALIVTFSES